MREKLLNLIYDSDPISHDGSGYVDYAKIADYLIANGVTFAEDNNVGDKKPMTNGERIRAMTDEELADFLSDTPWECKCLPCRICGRYVNKTCLSVDDWLKQPVEVDHDTEA